MSPKLILLCILLCLMSCKYSDGKCETCFPCERLYSFTVEPTSTISNIQTKVTSVTVTSTTYTTPEPLQLALTQDNESEYFSGTFNTIWQVANDYGGLVMVACIFQLLILNILQLCRDKNPSERKDRRLVNV